MCDFPAMALLTERRRMAEFAAQTDDMQRIEQCSNFVLRCDQLRMVHEEITGCTCWYEAVKAANV